jgi:hypothetical protein
VHHLRKQPADDPVDAVLGSIGLTGSPDGVFVLTRERRRHDATLFMTGRDIEERELALKLDPETFAWTILGDVDEYRMSRERADILAVIKDLAIPATPASVADVLGKNVNTVKNLMRKMVLDGALSNEHGKFSLSIIYVVVVVSVVAVVSVVRDRKKGLPGLR